MLKSALAYKTKQDKDFLGEYLIKFKVFLYFWGWYNTSVWVHELSGNGSCNACTLVYTDMSTSFSLICRQL